MVKDGDEEHDGDEDTTAILARRRSFVVKALGGVAVVAAACTKEPAPHPCLSVTEPRTSTVTSPLEIRPINPADASAVGTTMPDAAAEPEEPKPPPEPCLKIRMPDPDAGPKKPTIEEPPPRPCLKVARPKDR